MHGSDVSFYRVARVLHGPGHIGAEPTHDSLIFHVTNGVGYAVAFISICDDHAINLFDGLSKLFHATRVPDKQVQVKDMSDTVGPFAGYMVLHITVKIKGVSQEPTKTKGSPALLLACLKCKHCAFGTHATNSGHLFRVSTPALSSLPRVMFVCLGQSAVGGFVLIVQNLFRLHEVTAFSATHCFQRVH